MRVLTEPQERTLRGRVNELPERAPSPIRYPPARARGTVRLPSGATVAAAAAPALAAGARTRILNWAYNSTAFTRTTITLGQFNGPAIIKGVECYTSPVPSGVGFTIELGKAATAIDEAAVPLATPRPYSLLTEMRDPFNAVQAASGEGLILSTIPNTIVQYERLVDILIMDPSFYAVVAIYNNSGAGSAVVGKVRIIENISQDAAANFL